MNDTNSEKLLPCPFCGADAHVAGNRNYVGCRDCLMTHVIPAHVWNRRADNAELEQLRKENEELKKASKTIREFFEDESAIRKELESERASSKRLAVALEDLLNHGLVYETGEVHQADAEKAKEALALHRSASDKEIHVTFENKGRLSPLLFDSDTQVPQPGNSDTERRGSTTKGLSDEAGREG